MLDVERWMLASRKPMAVDRGRYFCGIAYSL